ncbi:hypothetical protein [Bacillus sp. V5-8f]|uniref:hypothetical protein n=1 Tax=Bacillus sp. V5-8f TaxID=2053044 RepID=UPI000C760FCE|nr:hypothetical protein [Bacillus sp. V5-8f]PLT32714.1 hypothetical protein CUU64_17535 [Bacillus sp. V5-8f]
MNDENYYVEVFKDSNLFIAFASKKPLSYDINERIGRGTDLFDKHKAVKNAILNFSKRLCEIYGSV